MNEQTDEKTNETKERTKKDITKLSK